MLHMLGLARHHNCACVYQAGHMFRVARWQGRTDGTQQDFTQVKPQDISCRRYRLVLWTDRLLVPARPSQYQLGACLGLPGGRGGRTAHNWTACGSNCRTYPACRACGTLIAFTSLPVPARLSQCQLGTCSGIQVAGAGQTSPHTGVDCAGHTLHDVPAWVCSML